ncbi:MAG: hypothetical protein ACI9RO_002263 [Alteromonas macleodii]|jgi:hypothetical protein
MRSDYINRSIKADFAHVLGLFLKKLPLSKQQHKTVHLGAQYAIWRPINLKHTIKTQQAAGEILSMQLKDDQL